MATSKPALLKNPFVNRVVGSGEESPEQLLANPANFRIHPDFQQQSLAGSIDSIGYIDPVLVNKRTGMVIDGHLRVTLALRSGVKMIPVTYVDLSEDEEKLALLSLDPIAALAATDRDKLDDLLRQVNSDDERVQQMLAEIAEREHLQYGESPPEAPEPDVDHAEELRIKWGVNTGDLWEVGKHRLLCADCLDIANIERLLDGKQPNMIFADPPYGVNIVATNVSVGGGEAYNIPFGGRKNGKGLRGSDGASKPFGSKAVRGTVGAAHIVDAGKYVPVIGDETTETVCKSSGLLLANYPSAAHIWWGGNYYADHLPASSCWLIWNKETTGDFADCELAWTNQDKAARLFTHRWNGMLRDSERGRRWHPTQKPAALAAWVFNLLGKTGDIILDPFVGCGTSLVAAQQYDRTVYGLEMSAEYIAISLQRLADMGLEPRLITG
jgi:hypothetical protein